MIPKVFHFVWCGMADIGAENLRWMRSWATFNPDWESVLWMEHPQPVYGFEVRPLPPLVNRRFYDGIEQWVSERAAIAARSDIVRMEIIARFGGLYLDTDVECFKPLGSLLDNVKLAYFDEFGPCNGNYAFAAEQNHPATWTAVRELGPWLASHKEAFSALDATGPNYLAPKLRTHPDCVIFPHMILNPLTARADQNQVEVWPEVSIGNHHYQGTWYDQKLVAPPEEFLRGDK